MKHPILLLGLTAIALSACGGGGSSKHVSPHGNSGGNAYPPHTNSGGNTYPPHTTQPNLPAYKVAAPKGTQKAEIDKAIANTNKLRAEKGLPALQYDPALSAYAQKRAEEIVKLFDHTRPNGQSWRTGVKGSYSGENIAAGNATADKTVLDQWRNSKGHYENMIRPGFTRIGIGFVYVPNSQYRYYWVQIFGNDSVTSQYSFDNSNTHHALVLPATEANILSHINTLNIDGKHIPLAPTGTGNWHTINAQGYTGEFGSNTTFSRYGIVKSNGAAAYRSFHQGFATPVADMPQAGEARYQGQGIAATGSRTTYLNTQFHADFDQKTLTGNLTGAQQQFEINAKIHGNTFTGTTGANVTAQGGFYGPNAAEVSGTFDDRQGTQGAFGATRR